VAAGAICISPPTTAQQAVPTPTAPPTATAGPASDGAAPVLDVVVTAQKRGQKLSEVPLSLTALTTEAMEDQGVKSIDDIARLTPGLNFQTTSQLGTTNISIRGIQSTVGTPTTGVYLDDVPIQGLSLAGLASNTYPKVFDLERVEVLRGPQGTLFGAGAEGGAIRFIPTAPSLTKTSGVFATELAFTENGAPSYELGAAVGAPIVDGTLGFRASVWGRRDGGYIDRVDPSTGAVIDKNANSDHTEIGQLAFVAAPMRGLTISPSIFFQTEDTRDKSFSWENSSLAPFQPRAQFQSDSKIRQPQSDKFYLPILSIQYDFDKVYVKSITSYFHRDNQRTDDYSYFEVASYALAANAILGTNYPTSLINLPGLPNNAVTNQLATGQRDWSQELRFGSNPADTGPLSWVGGAFYQHTTRTYDQSIIQNFDALSNALFGMPAAAFFGEAPIGPGGIYSYQEQGIFKVQQFALFGQADYKVTPALTATVGLRVARSGFSFTDHQDGPDGPGMPVDFGGSNKETPVTPKFSLKYDIAPGEMVYGAATKGYRIGGANEDLGREATCKPDLATLNLSDNPLTYGSDSVWSYELGSKNRLFGGKVSLDASLFWVNWKNIQGNVFLPTCALSYTTDFGKAVSRGFDVQASAKLGGGFTLAGSLGYTDARYAQTTYNSAGGILARSGDEIGTPPLTGTIGLQYDFQIGSGADAFVRSDVQYASSYDRTGSAGVIGYDASTRVAPATTFVTLRAGYELDRWKFALFVNNLLNSQTSLLRVHDTTVTTEGYRDITYRPRTVGVDAEYRF